MHGCACALERALQNTHLSHTHHTLRVHAHATATAGSHGSRVCTLPFRGRSQCVDILMRGIDALAKGGLMAALERRSTAAAAAMRLQKALYARNPNLCALLRLHWGSVFSCCPPTCYKEMRARVRAHAVQGGRPAPAARQRRPKKSWVQPFAPSSLGSEARLISVYDLLPQHPKTMMRCVQPAPRPDACMRARGSRCRCVALHSRGGASTCDVGRTLAGGAHDRAAQCGSLDASMLCVLGLG